MASFAKAKDRMPSASVERGARDDRAASISWTPAWPR
jgi:hypothetical protein